MIAQPTPANRPYIGRFAPSPTGPLHAGSLVAAVASYLDARANQGRWHLRIDDIDETRCKPEYADNIIRTMHLFGFRWDEEIVVQSRQKQYYKDALQQLLGNGQVYACVCSRREIADSGIEGIDGPVYPGTCRAAGHPIAEHALRVLTNEQAITFDDRLQGRQSQCLVGDVGDFVVRRRDQLFAYQLAVVVDDHNLGVTDIVRGADLLDSTARQIHLQQLLGYVTPHYLHIPAATNRDGLKLSKQTLAPAISANHAVLLLQQCLVFLRQTLPSNAAILSPFQLLDRATGLWRPEALPQRRAIIAG